MNKMIRTFVSLLLVVCLIFSQLTLTPKAIEDTTHDISIEAATIAVTESLGDLLSALSASDTFVSRISSIENVVIWTPYIVFHSDTENQYAVYYFPLVDLETEKVVYLTEAIYYEGNYIVNALDAFVDALNAIDYVNNDCVVYMADNKIYIESNTQFLSITDYYYSDDTVSYTNTREEETTNSFVGLDFSKKKDYISARTDNLLECTYCNGLNDIDYLNAKSYGILTLYKPQGQYGYNMCWASAVATVLNYLRGTVVTGFEVCTRMGIGYDSGGNAYNIQDALAKYNVSYNYIRSSSLTWSQIIQNIDNEKPIIANCFPYGGTEGHAITIYGYTGTVSTTRYVYYWNSATNSSGAISNFEFGTGTGVFSNADGEPWFWETTVSYY